MFFTTRSEEVWDTRTKMFHVRFHEAFWLDQRNDVVSRKLMMVVLQNVTDIFIRATWDNTAITARYTRRLVLYSQKKITEMVLICCFRFCQTINDWIVKNVLILVTTWNQIIYRAIFLLFYPQLVKIIICLKPASISLYISVWRTSL